MKISLSEELWMFVGWACVATDHPALGVLAFALALLPVYPSLVAWAQRREEERKVNR